MQATDAQHEMLDWTRRKSGRQQVSATTASRLIVITAILTSIVNHQIECRELKPSIEKNTNLTATTTTTTPPSRASQVESLAKLLQATDQRQRAAEVGPEARNNSTSQQHEQLYLNALANKKISCDELSLVVLAQRVLNMSSTSATIRRLIECKQENLLDANLMDMFARRNDGDQQVAATIRQQPPPPPPSPFMDQEALTVESQFAGGPHPNQSLEVHRREQQEERLHFGAKMAISLLVTIIALVAVATALDYQLEPVQSSCENGPNQRARKSDLRAGKRTRAKKESYQAAKLRDYRSLSMSSNCSSNLFCSTSSVASSSAPILGSSTTNSCSGGGGGGNLRTQTGGSEQPRRRYETNLQLHFNQQSNCSSESGISVAGSATTTMLSNVDAKQQNQEVAAPADEPTSGQAINYQINMATVREECTVRSEIVHEKTRPDSTAELLARQVLLAFSLRQSARAIFEHSPAQQQQQQRAGQQKSPRLAEPSARSAQEDAHESVDSLHGLRFLSMIWVIVIHSYNFALRWMFFSNTNTLDGIYKSAASQLIANGSFACDSFFFAGGFLLPYLAYPAQSDNSTSAQENQPTESSENVGLSPRMGTEPEVGPATGGCGSKSAPAATCCCPSVTTKREPPIGVPPPLPLSSPTCCFSCCRYLTTVDNVSETKNQHARQDLHTDELRGSPPPPPVVTIINMEPPTKRTVTGAEPSPRVAHARGATANRDLKPEAASAAKNTTEAAAAAGAANRPGQPFTCKQIVANVCHRYARMMPLMMAIIGLCSTLLRYLGEGALWRESTMMYDDWCRRNWWVNAMFLHNFVNRENMCLSHSWYSAVDFQLFLMGQLILWTLNKSKRLGYLLLFVLLAGSPLLTMLLTLKHHLPAVPLVANVNESTMNLYYGEIYIKPYSRASPYLVGMLLAYLLRTTKLAQWRPTRWQVATGWTLSLGTFASILMAMQPAMNGRTPSELESALYSGWSRPLWACATGWMIFACMTKHGGPIERLLSARLFVPFSRLTYPAFLIHPIVMALFYGSRASSFQFSHYLMLYLILGNIVITYASAFVLAALFELPLLSIERILSRRIFAQKVQDCRRRRQTIKSTSSN